MARLTPWYPKSARDDLHLVRLAVTLPVRPGKLERRLVRLGAATRKEDRLHVRVADLDELAGQFDRRDVDLAGVVRDEGNLADLLGGGLGKLAAAVANVHVPELREPVNVFFPAGVANDGALATHQDHRSGRFVAGRVVQWMNQMRLIERDQLFDAKSSILSSLSCRAPLPTAFQSPFYSNQGVPMQMFGPRTLG